MTFYFKDERGTVLEFSTCSKHDREEFTAQGWTEVNESARKAYLVKHAALLKSAAGLPDGSEVPALAPEAVMLATKTVNGKKVVEKTGVVGGDFGAVGGESLSAE